MDRGCLDFSRLFALHKAQAFFVTCFEDNIKFKRLCSLLAVGVASVFKTNVENNLLPLQRQTLVCLKPFTLGSHQTFAT